MIDGDTIRLVKNASAFCFKEGRLSTTGDSDIEHNKHVGQVSTNMRSFTSKNGYLLSLFDKIDDSPAQIRNTSMKHLLVNNHDVEANKGKTK